MESLAALLESVDRSQNQHWFSQWWNHPEAVDRFRGLYEQWLEAQANGACRRGGLTTTTATPPYSSPNEGLSRNAGPFIRTRLPVESSLPTTRRPSGRGQARKRV